MVTTFTNPWIIHGRLAVVNGPLAQNVQIAFMPSLSSLEKDPFADPAPKSCTKFPRPGH
jgi:hypothetical protein